MGEKKPTKEARHVRQPVTEHGDVKLNGEQSL